MSLGHYSTEKINATSQLSVTYAWIPSKNSIGRLDCVTYIPVLSFGNVFVSHNISGELKILEWGAIWKAEAFFLQTLSPSQKMSDWSWQIESSTAVIFLFPHRFQAHTALSIRRVKQTIKIHMYIYMDGTQWFQLNWRRDSEPEILPNFSAYIS